MYGMSSIEVTLFNVRDCLRFCFMHLIQEDLYKVSFEWNTHRIRPTHGAMTPSGRLNEFTIYHSCMVCKYILHNETMIRRMLQIFAIGTQNYICTATANDLAIAQQ